MTAINTGQSLTGPAPTPVMKSRIERGYDYFFARVVWSAPVSPKAMSDFELAERRVKVWFLRGVGTMLILGSLASLVGLATCFCLAVELIGERQVDEPHMKFLSAMAAICAFAFVGCCILLGRSSHVSKPADKNPWERFPTIIGSALEKLSELIEPLKKYIETKATK